MKVFLPLPLLFLTLFSKAQEPVLYFEKLTVQNGLSHNKANCILQDKRGFIWIGTDDGLNRYDGKSFLVLRHRHNDSSSISGNIITDLLEDEQGRLWIATADGGLSRYDFRLPPWRQFRQYRHSKDSLSIPSNIINAMVEDNEGYLWLATGGSSVVRFDKKTEEFIPFPKNSKTVLDVVLDEKNNIWAGREGGGILKINPRIMDYEEDDRYKNLYAKLPHAAVTALFLDKEKNMWYGSWDRVLYRYHATRKREEVFRNTGPSSFNNDEILSFAEDNDGRLWMGGSSKGLHIYDKQQQQFHHYGYDPSQEGSISDNRINCIYKDGHGRMWLGTNKGVCINNPEKQRFVQTFLRSTDQKKGITIYDFYEDAKGDIWIGTSEGIYVKKKDGTLSGKRVFFKNYPLQVTCFFRDADDRFYIGTDYSLFLYDEGSGTVRLLPNTDKDKVMNHIIDSRVVSVIKETIDGNPVLVTAPYGHYLAYYDLKEKKWVSRLDSSKNIIQRFNLKDNLIRKFYKTRNGAIWMATAKAGLGLWSPYATPSVSYYSNDPHSDHSIASNNIYDMLEDKKGNLWISTYGAGLQYFDTGKRRFIQIPGSNNLLEGLQLDNRGNIWMISNGHLQKYHIENQSFSNYTLPDLEKSGGVRGRIFKDSKGRLYAAGTNYFISFDPDSLRESNDPTRVYLTDFYIFNNSMSHLLGQDKIKLNYKSNYFTIDFAAPNFIPGTTVHYSYKLDGFDKEWINAGERSYVSYSNLEGGTYTFKVRATHTPGIWSREFAAIDIVVTPPFWKTIWFYILCSLFISVSVYALYRYRINELLKRQSMRNRIAQDLHDNVGSTLSSISVYSQVAKIYHQQHKMNDLQNTLEKISSASSEMISELNDTVWAINPRNDNMQLILQRMDSLARPLLASQQIQLHFNYDEEIAMVNLDMGKRKNFYLVFKEVVNNSLKYAACKNLYVHIELKGKFIEMTIRDDGKGFDLTKTSEGYKSSDVFGGGNGLKNMQWRAKEMKGILKITSAPEEGTLTELHFPIT
jgi:ligand-binding sensor domain-containing protein/two-component sensor histidine kinase